LLPLADVDATTASVAAMARDRLAAQIARSDRPSEAARAEIVREVSRAMDDALCATIEGFSKLKTRS
jgi:hypothetical protein